MNGFTEEERTTFTFQLGRQLRRHLLDTSWTPPRHLLDTSWTPPGHFFSVGRPDEPRGEAEEAADVSQLCALVADLFDCWREII